MVETGQKLLFNSNEFFFRAQNGGLIVIHHYDVLIIGGGLTGLRAALRISDAGLNGAVVSKVHPLRSHSVAAQGVGTQYSNSTGNCDPCLTS